MASIVVLVVLGLGLLGGLTLIAVGIVMRKQLHIIAVVALIVGGAIVLLPCLVILFTTVMVIAANMHIAR
jgi:hypothetical protein